MKKSSIKYSTPMADGITAFNATLKPAQQIAMQLRNIMFGLNGNILSTLNDVEKMLTTGIPAQGNVTAIDGAAISKAMGEVDLATIKDQINQYRTFLKV